MPRLLAIAHVCGLNVLAAHALQRGEALAMAAMREKADA